MKARPFFPIWRVGDRTFADASKAGEYALHLARLVNDPITIYERHSMEGGWVYHCELLPTRANTPQESAQ